MTEKVQSPFRAAVNAVKPKAIDKMGKFAGDFEQLSDAARLSVRAGRNLSLFQTKLEEAAMFLNKAITHDGLIDDANDTDGA